MNWAKFFRGVGVAFLDGSLAAVTAAGVGTAAGVTVPTTRAAVVALGLIAFVGGGKGVVRYLQNSETAVAELPSILPK
jgi:hypothetical protein